MFSKTIIDSDMFLDMPLSAQALYFHLSMRADDEGFVNSPKKIQRQICASDDDLKLLKAKRFLIPFESGVVVIKHWYIHNYIRADRKHRTNYTEELACLDIKDNGAYTIKKDIKEIDGQVTVNCPSSDNLDKNSIDKNRIDKDSVEETPHAFGVYNNVYLTKGELEDLVRQYPDDYKDMIENLSFYMRSKGKRYDDHYATLMKWKHDDEKKKAKPKENYDYRKDVK